jgi:hypothetical protein
MTCAELDAIAVAVNAGRMPTDSEVIACLKHIDVCERCFRDCERTFDGMDAASQRHHAVVASNMRSRIDRRRLFDPEA